MSFYHLRTSRPYTEKDGKLSFDLRGISIEKELKKAQPGKSVKISVEKGFCSKLNGGGGVYVISIINTKNNKEDICYVGSAKSLLLRLSNHQTIAFLAFYLCLSFKIELHILHIDNFRSVERNLIGKTAPFLNKVQQSRSFNIKRKDFKKSHRGIFY